MEEISLDSPEQMRRRDSVCSEGKVYLDKPKYQENILDSLEDEEHSQSVCAFFEPVLQWLNRLLEYFLHFLSPDSPREETAKGPGSKKLDLFEEID